YRLPNFDFIFGENLGLGDPIISNNFQDFPFLAQGSGPLLGSGSVVRQLTPWPGSTAPTPVTCVPGAPAPPIAYAGADIVVAAGLPESLFGTVIEERPNAGFPHDHLAADRRSRRVPHSER